MCRKQAVAVFLALLALTLLPGTYGASAAKTRIWYGTCFRQVDVCMVDCIAVEGGRASNTCLASCLKRSRCESDRENEQREAMNSNLPESTLPQNRLPGSTLPDDRLPDSRLP